MRLPEQRVWDKLRSRCGAPSILVKRLENLVAIGDPDVYAIHSGLVTWMELKAVEGIPVRADTPLLGKDCVTIEQRNWHLDWRKHGGRSLVVIGIGSRDVVAIDNAHIDRVNELSFAQCLEVAVAVNWDELKEYLCGRYVGTAASNDAKRLGAQD